MISSVCQAQQIDADSLLIKKDSISVSFISDSIQNDSSKLDKSKAESSRIIENNKWLSNDKIAIPVYQSFRVVDQNDKLFYGVAFLFIVFGILKISFAKYFQNLIRVFFNTSLRQIQLKDQLLQDKLPSLFFNLFFIIVGGAYIFLLMAKSKKIPINDYQFFYFGMAAVLVTYTTKLAIIQFLGWLSGFKKEAEVYSFIVFLINKILAVALLPLIVVIAFASKPISEYTILISLILIAFLFVLRYLRIFGSIQHSLKVSKFHFILFVISIEILPIMLIYQLANNFIDKSL